MAAQSPVGSSGTHWNRLCSRIATIRPAALLFVLATTALPGCTHVIPQSTPYYKNGPDQPEGPQGDIPAGAKAWVLWRKNTYAHVWTDGGIDGWVWDRAVVSVWEQERQAREEK